MSEQDWQAGFETEPSTTGQRERKRNRAKTGLETKRGGVREGRIWQQTGTVARWTEIQGCASDREDGIWREMENAWRETEVLSWKCHVRRLRQDAFVMRRSVFAPRQHVFCLGTTRAHV